MLFLVVLYVHVVATLVLASSFAIETVSVWRMRRAETVSEARLWVDVVSKVPVIIGVSGLVLFFSGGYMTHKMDAWTLAWPKVAVVALILLGPFGAVSGRRMRGIRRMLQNEANESELARALSDRFLTLSLNLRLWILAGIVLLMTVRPSGTASVVIIAASAVLGLLPAVVGSKREANLRAFDTTASSRS
jgi:hypothetical protein